MRVPMSLCHCVRFECTCVFFAPADDRAPGVSLSVAGAGTSGECVRRECAGARGVRQDERRARPQLRHAAAARDLLRTAQERASPRTSKCRVTQCNLSLSLTLLLYLRFYGYSSTLYARSACVFLELYFIASVARNCEYHLTIS